MSLKETQGCCLGILKELNSYCDAKGLKYYLIGGSALGAVRHGGFIPWDDDIDVGMPRPDYERFCEGYDGSGSYKLSSLGRTQGYFNPFAKLCDTRTVYEEPTSRCTARGVFVDIFPIDYVCDSQKAIQRAMLKKRLYNHAFTIKLDAQVYRAEPMPKRIARKAMGKVYATRDPIAVSQAITSSISSSVPTQYMMNVWGAWNEREIMEADWFGEGAALAFEDMKCLIPSNWDKYLTRLYGDYMSLPKDPPHYHGSAFRREGYVSEKEGDRL